MPTAHIYRQERREFVLRLLEGERLGSQEEVLVRLHAHGYAATQSSVSRDLRDLGVAKIGGRYVLPKNLESGDHSAPREIRSFVRAVRLAGPHLTVILTLSGAAQAVAVALDGAGWPEIVGTVAGDDTLFIATAHVAAQRALLARLRQVLDKEMLHGGG